MLLFPVPAQSGFRMESTSFHEAGRGRALGKLVYGDLDDQFRDERACLAMKMMTILGTRPEIIRLSRVMNRLDQCCTQVVVHTGQNYDHRLNGLFFEELQLRPVDHVLNSRGTLAQQLSEIFVSCEKLLRTEKPDRVLLLGDTNTGLVAILAKRMGIPVIHMEAGNRCGNDRVPEEVNRRLIDHASDLLLPYTEVSRRNLLAEGIPAQRIFVTGNPIYEVIQHYEPRIRSSSVLTRIGIAVQGYFLVTLHRAENVDDPMRLKHFVTAFELLQQEFSLPVIVSTHPRMRSRMQEFAIDCPNAHVQFCEPFGFFDFIHLERHARCVLSDSGTVQEECALAGVPNVTLRNETERPETIECGSSTLTGDEPETILQAVQRTLSNCSPRRIPPEYLSPNVSHVVTQIALGQFY